MYGVTMEQANTIAVFGDRDFEGALKSNLPDYEIRIGTPGRIRTLIRRNEIGYVASRLPLSRTKDLIYRNIVRESLEHGIGALFWARTPKEAVAVLGARFSEPSVFVVYGTAEIPEGMGLLRRRIKEQMGIGAATEPVGVGALDGNPFIEKVTGFLRNKASGRLDVKKVAGLFKEDLKRFAKALNVSSAAISQTPDSKKYQGFLGYFERAARIIPMLESPDMFATWAKTPNKELNGESPLELLFAGPEKAQRLAETVEDVLVGQPD